MTQSEGNKISMSIEDFLGTEIPDDAELVPITVSASILDCFVEAEAQFNSGLRPVTDEQREKFHKHLDKLMILTWEVYGEPKYELNLELTVKPRESMNEATTSD